MAWVFEGAQTRKIGSAIVAARTIIRDNTAVQAAGEPAETFQARSQRAYIFTRRTKPDGTFDQTAAQFRDMVRQETAAHLAALNAADAWTDATAEFTP